MNPQRTMAARQPPYVRSTSAASNPSTQQQQQQLQPQQQQQHPIRRNLFAGSLTRRPLPVSAPASSEALTPHVQGTSTALTGSGFTPAPSFHHSAHPADDGATDDEDADDEDVHAADMEDNAILVPDSHVGGDAFSKKAAAEKEMLVRFLEEAAAEAAAAAGEDGDGGDGVGVGRDDSARLIEMYRSHARQRIDPNEVRPAVQESLLRKVASLHDDKWMYEPESDSEES